MLEIKNIQVFSLERSSIAAGNSMTVGEINTLRQFGKNDEERFIKLGKTASGCGHDNFLKGIIVQFDIKYPQYWTPEAQRYHWLEIVSSQSKMHKLTVAGLDKDFDNYFNKYVDSDNIARIQEYVKQYNNEIDNEKKYFLFMKIISNLPMGYEMWETITTNYLQLKTIYKQRKNHKLKEDWGAFCAMIENFPMADIIFSDGS